MAYYKTITDDLIISALDSQNLDNYREFEDILFNSMCGIKDRGRCPHSIISRLSGASLNRLGYLLSLLSIPVVFQPDFSAPIVALYWKNNEIDNPVANRLDEVAAHWRLSKGIEMNRWKQFLSTSMC